MVFIRDPSSLGIINNNPGSLQDVELNTSSRGWQDPGKVMFQNRKIVWVRYDPYYSLVSTNRLAEEKCSKELKIIVFPPVEIPYGGGNRGMRKRLPVINPSHNPCPILPKAETEEDDTLITAILSPNGFILTS